MGTNTRVCVCVWGGGCNFLYGAVLGCAAGIGILFNPGLYDKVSV